MLVLLSPSSQVIVEKVLLLSLSLDTAANFRYF